MASLDTIILLIALEGKTPRGAPLRASLQLHHHDHVNTRMLLTDWMTPFLLPDQRCQRPDGINAAQ